MTETEEVTRGLPSRSHCGGERERVGEMDCSGREKSELKLSGRRFSRSERGSIRITLDDGWGGEKKQRAREEKKEGTARVKFTLGE